MLYLTFFAMNAFLPSALLFITCLLSLPATAQAPPNDDLSVERMPAMRTDCPPGEGYKECVNVKFLEYVYSRLQYPERARKKGLEGLAVVSFVVEPDGMLSTFQIVRDPGMGCGKELVRVLKTMNENGPSWIPGIQGGEYVRVAFNLPVNFGLTME